MTPPLRLKRLHHIARVTTRPEESTAFYRDVLGFRELERPNFNFRGAWLYNFGVQIHIIENVEAAPSPSTEIDTRANHLAFEADEVDSIKETLQARNIPFRENLNAGGTYQIFFQDPDGHHIEVAVYGQNPDYIDAPKA